MSEEAANGLSRGAVIGILVAIIVLGSVVTYGRDGGGARTSADSLSAAVAACEQVARAEVIAPDDARISGLSMRFDDRARAFVGKGGITGPNRAGVKVSNPFVCVVKPDSDVTSVLFRNRSPDLYATVVQEFGL